ncbi:MAG: CPBP family intramembrane glutamic endopeptidase [Sphingomonas sp.]
MALPLALLLVALTGMALLVRRDVDAYRRFKALTDTRARQRQFRLWIVSTFVLFVGYSLLSLALLDRISDLNELPAEFVPAWAALGGAGDTGPGDLATGLGIGMGMAGGIAIGLAIALRRRGKRASAPRQLGDISALMPRNYAELAHCAVLSVNAGLTEELFFRLTLPLLLVLVIGNVWVAFALATIVFGLAHCYQGWLGILATTVIGSVLALIYLASANLWLVVMLHALIDVAGLVIRPWLSGALRPAQPST